MCQNEEHRIVVSYNLPKFQAANLKNEHLSDEECLTALVSYKNRLVNKSNWKSVHKSITCAYNV